MINTQHVNVPKNPHVNRGEEVTVTLTLDGAIVFPWPKGEGMPGEFKVKVEQRREENHKGIVWIILECTREDYGNTLELWNCEDRWFIRNYCL